MGNETGFDAQRVVPSGAQNISFRSHAPESPVARQYIVRSGALVTEYRPGDGCADIIAYGKPAKPQRI